MRSVAWMVVAAVVVVGGCERGSDESPKKEPAAPTATPTPVASADSCEAQRTAITNAANKAAECTSDDQCAIISVGKCNIDGLHCYEAAVNKDSKADIAALRAAIEDYGPTCEQSKCRCSRPDSATCKANRCTP